MKKILVLLAMTATVIACNNAGDGSTNPVDSMNRSGPIDTSVTAPLQQRHGGDTAAMGDTTVKNR
jgi:hypothetical protein